MAKYAVSDDGVEALYACADRVEECLDTIRSETHAMRSATDDYADTLGPHRAELASALEDIASAVEQASEPAEDIAELIRDVADGYREIMDSDLFGGIGSAVGKMVAGAAAAFGIGAAVAGAGAGGGNSGPNSNSGSEAGGNSGDPKTDQGTGSQKCLGVSVRGKIPDGYENVIKSRYENADPTAKKVFDKFAGNLEIQNSEYPSDLTAHYSPVGTPAHPRGVYYNASADLNNPRGAGATYYHELGHMIDHASSGYKTQLSDNAEFEKALRDDGNKVLSVYKNMSDEKKKGFLKYIRQDSAHSFSDLIDAITGGELQGYYGHEREYWSRKGSLTSEAFAHFFEASMGGGSKAEFLSRMFPNAFAKFKELIGSVSN
ncbi:MAG: hypothetical protein K5871_08905 [Lachnospiraceae bacterium]|nr:hypothetical protein [Lachnospiraceae bacterium]